MDNKYNNSRLPSRDKQWSASPRVRSRNLRQTARARPCVRGIVTPKEIKITPINDTRIIIYIHVCTINTWETVLAHLVNVIIDSGLIECVEEIRLGILGDVFLVNNFLETKVAKYIDKFELIFNSSDTLLYERPTLEHLAAASQTTDFKVLYLHTKGVANKNNDVRQFIHDWIDTMLYHCVYRHTECLSLLQDHCTVGINAHTRTVPDFHAKNASTWNMLHYSGNFWWSKSEYIRTLPLKIGPGYIDPETWVGIKLTNICNLFQPHHNFYTGHFPHNRYCKTQECKHLLLGKSGIIKKRYANAGMRVSRDTGTQTTSKILVYIHVCTIGDWDDVLSYLLTKIVESDLIKVVDQIRLGVLGDADKVRNFLESSFVEISRKIAIIFESTQKELYERPTLEHLRESATTETFNVLYLHTKGIRDKNKTLRKNIQHWIDMMLYFLVEQHSNCLKLLGKHPTVGTNMYTRINKDLQRREATTTNTKHYSGNFWWATSEYIRKLPEKIGSGYLDPELWIGTAATVLHSVHQPRCNNFYFKEYPPQRYRNVSEKGPRQRQQIEKPVNHPVRRIRAVPKKIIPTITDDDKKIISLPDTPIVATTKLKVPVYIYFHICTINNWQDIVVKIFSLIKSSGLLEIVTGINVTVLGNNVEKVKEILNDKRVNIIYTSPNVRIYERKCLLLLHEHSQREEFKVLYLHSKGITRRGNKGCVHDWTSLMLYFNVEHYKRCLQILQEYDCCGVNIETIGDKDLRHLSPLLGSTCHFSGNFWWANSTYIKTLPDHIGPKYLDPEAWIANAVKKKMYSFWQSGVCHYKVSYPAEKYRGKQQKFMAI